MTNAQLKGLVDAPFSEPDLTQQYVKDDLHVFSTGLRLDVPEEQMIRYDGKVLMCHTVKSPIFDARGKDGEVSEKQWRDIVSVLRISGDTMDDAYLDSWSSRLSLEVLLRRAREAPCRELPSR